eukprot:4852135-Amphidinium_carterae.1
MKSRKSRNGRFDRNFLDFPCFFLPYNWIKGLGGDHSDEFRGHEVTRFLAQKGGTVYMICRSRAKAEAVQPLSQPRR